MHMELARWGDQTIDDQQLEHLFPTYHYPPIGYLPLPKRVQLQLAPQLTAQPAASKQTGSMQLHLPELDLNRVEVTGGDFTVFREQAENAGSVPVFVKNLNRLAPGGFLFAADFAKVQNSSLGRLAKSTAVDSRRR